MRADGYNVGGEQSGHILMTDFSPTGDGTVAALQVLAEIQRRGKPASEILKVFEAVPQMLKNVTYDAGAPMTDKNVLEGDDLSKVDSVTDDIVNVIRNLAA
jgi:phosphoglucosamine mutase